MTDPDTKAFLIGCAFFAPFVALICWAQLCDPPEEVQDSVRFERAGYPPLSE